jgi:hypothetical protein
MSVVAYHYKKQEWNVFIIKTIDALLRDSKATNAYT